MIFSHQDGMRSHLKNIDFNEMLTNWQQWIECVLCVNVREAYVAGLSMYIVTIDEWALSFFLLLCQTIFARKHILPTGGRSRAFEQQSHIIVSCLTAMCGWQSASSSMFRHHCMSLPLHSIGGNCCLLRIRGVPSLSVHIATYSYERYHDRQSTISMWW